MCILLSCTQALTDSEAAVVCDAVRCMGTVAQHLRKRSLLAAAHKVRLLLSRVNCLMRKSIVLLVRPWCVCMCS
jgi:hypothetical protein